MEIINTFKQSIGKTSSSVGKHKLPRDTNKQHFLFCNWRRRLCRRNFLQYFA